MPDLLAALVPLGGLVGMRHFRLQDEALVLCDRDVRQGPHDGRGQGWESTGRGGLLSLKTNTSSCIVLITRK